MHLRRERGWGEDVKDECTDEVPCNGDDCPHCANELGYDNGVRDGAASRQAEVDALKAQIDAGILDAKQQFDRAERAESALAVAAQALKNAPDEAANSCHGYSCSGGGNNGVYEGWLETRDKALTQIEAVKAGGAP
jgi:hypothetical protein